MPDAVVQTRSLAKCYGALTALDDCSLEIPRGEVFGLLGPNGSGKTTLLRLLMGFLRPTRGDAAIDGLDCYRQSVAVHQREQERGTGSLTDALGQKYELFW